MFGLTNKFCARPWEKDIYNTDTLRRWTDKKPTIIQCYTLIIKACARCKSSITAVVANSRGYMRMGV